VLRQLKEVKNDEIKNYPNTEPQERLQIMRDLEDIYSRALSSIDWKCSIDADFLKRVKEHPSLKDLFYIRGIDIPKLQEKSK